MGSRLSSSRWPFSPSPPETRGGSLNVVSVVTVLLSVASIGASGWTSTTLRCVPRGAATAWAMADATPSGRRKAECRARPQRVHSASTSPVTSGSQSMPMPVRVGPGRTITARTPVPSSSICSAVTKPSSPHLEAT